jgi:HEAT repeat protein
MHIPSTPAWLLLSALSLGGGVSVDDPLDELRPKLADPSPRTRRRAVRATAELGTDEAWALVLEALADEEPEVGDAAQLALGGLTRADALKDLLGRGGLGARDERVRARAAEALGRVQARVDGGDLAKKISTRDPVLASSLLWSVERLALRERLGDEGGALERAVRRVYASRRWPDLRADALVALAALGPDDAHRLALDALGARDPELRCAALLAARVLRHADEAAWARALAADPDPGVRAQVLESLEGLGSLDALRVLIERVELETRLRLRWRALSALQRMTGMKYRFDTRPWRLWVERQSGDWRPGRTRPPEPAPGGTRAAGLSELRVESDRVCFLFDFSGSMWTKLKDGRTPKDVVAGELRVALERLPEETEFNLVPYTYDPHPWEEALRPAKPRNVRAALDFFERCREVGKGNFYDAALLALADPSVDTILVLTDGVPTGGSHCDMDMILPLFARANRYRKVTVDTLLVDAPRGAVRRWTELSRRTGGRAVEVKLE